MNLNVDVIIYDTVGMPYVGSTPDHSSLGGSEFAAIQVAKGFAANGLKVVIFNNTFDFEYTGEIEFAGEHYCHHSVSQRAQWTCKLLLVQRYTPVPTHIKYERLGIVMHDKPDGCALIKMADILANHPTAHAIYVSEWQKSLYPTVFQYNLVIPNIIPDIVYDIGWPSYENRKGRFIYASAASRGLKESLQMWQAIKGYNKDLQLFCCAPSYDPINDTTVPNYLGSLNFPALMNQLVHAEGLFFVHNNPETFCIVAAVAEALGCRVHALGLNGLGALPETVCSPFLTTNRYEFVRDFIDVGNKVPVSNRKYYGSKSVMPKWMELYNA